MIQKIAVLTSGGDAPGMNAAIRGVTRYADCKGIAVEGIAHGYAGLIEEEMRPLDRRAVGETIQRGGTFCVRPAVRSFLTATCRNGLQNFCGDDR